MENRLSKVLSRYGHASRRKAELLIREGKVYVNGSCVKQPEFFVSTLKDRIMINGSPLQKEPKKLYFLLHKPPGFVCSEKTFPNEKRLTDLLPKQFGRLFTVGRLDKQSSGLIFLTNDGLFAQKILHPSFQIQKEYVVKTKEELTNEHLIQIQAGGWVEGCWVRPVKVVKVRKGTSKIVLTDGKKREVRELYAQAHLNILELCRVRIGGLHLGNMPEGSYRQLSESEILALFS